MQLLLGLYHSLWAGSPTSGYAKAGDEVVITLTTSNDTWKTGNNATFSIGTETEIVASDFAPSTSNKTLETQIYTIGTSQNGTFTFTDLTFLNQYDNAIEEFTAPNMPATNTNIIVDTITLVILFTDNVGEDRVVTDTINITVTDMNEDISTYKYGFSTDAICNTSDTFGNLFISGRDLPITDNGGNYICAKATDLAGNTVFQASAFPLNINSLPIGNVTIDGIAIEDGTLTANTSDIADADSIDTIFARGII